MKKASQIFLCAALVAVFTTNAHASYLIRSWLVTGTEAPWDGGTDVTTTDPSMGLDATAASNTVNFQLPGGPGTLMAFLLSDPGTLVGTCSTVTVLGVTESCATDPISDGTATTETAATYGQILEITGFAVFSGSTTYTVTHDDGVIVLIDGTPVITSVGPQSAGVNSFTTTAGLHSVDIFYGECCGNPSELLTNLPSAVPEPGSWGLLAAGVAACVARLRRRPRT